tara:strand:- start:2474 stop:2686 length:213 start_codon:yes stop_codon:yes gene_type:complete
VGILFSRIINLGGVFTPLFNRRKIMAKKGLYYNINQRKKKGISRPKSKSTITPKAYANMKAGFPKKKKRG